MKSKTSKIEHPPCHNPPMWRRILLAAMAVGVAVPVGALVGAAIAFPQPTTADRCTNQINYVFDPLSNAEINSIGATTGQCPVPNMSAPDAWSDARLVGQSIVAWQARAYQKAWAGNMDTSDEHQCTLAAESWLENSPAVGLDRSDVIAGCMDALS